MIAAADCGGLLTFILWAIAAVLAVIGIIRLITLDWIGGILLLVLACIIGPGGMSLFC